MNSLTASPHPFADLNHKDALNSLLKLQSHEHTPLLCPHTRRV